MKNRKKEVYEILEDLRGDHKAKIMLYIDEEIQKNFKIFCKNKKIRMSTLVEKLVKKFLEEVKD